MADKSNIGANPAVPDAARAAAGAHGIPDHHELSQEEIESLQMLMGGVGEEEAAARRVVRFFRRNVNRARKLWLCGEGFTLKGARLWIRRCRADWRVKAYPRRDIRWAHAHGFSAPQVERYGVMPQNVDDFISERSYDFLQPINGKYDKWFSDRVTTRVIAGDAYRDLFETIHFNIVSRQGELLFIPLSDQAKAAVEAASTPEEGFIAFLQSDLSNVCLSGSSWFTKDKFAVKAYQRKNGAWRYRLGEVRLSQRGMFSYILHRAEQSPLVLYERAAYNELFTNLEKNSFGNVCVLVCNLTGSKPQISDAFVRFCDEAEEDQHTGLSDEDMESAESEQEYSREADDDDFGDNADEEPVLKYYALPIDLETGIFDGGRAMFTRGKFVDTKESLATGIELKGTVEHWDEIKRALVAFCAHVPQVELVQLTVRLTPAGFKIVGVNPSPRYNRAYPLPRDLMAFLNGKVADKRASKGSSVALVRHAAFLRSRRAFTKFFYPAGMVYYQGLRYPHDVIQDFFSRNGISLSKKIWAYRHGFLSYRLDLYPELCDENWQSYVTDLEYRWLRHINPKYRTWMEDKLTFKYLLSDFSECLPGYYFFTSCRAGENRIIPMMDCPEGYDATVEDILRLAREKGVLALKPDEGSHGEGFYKLTYTEEEGYALNGEAVPAEKVEEILRNPSNQYLVSEYIELHPDLKRIYPGSVNTVRVTVFKRDGVHPQIGNAYLRIGSERSGAVDNVVAGGFVAEVDVATGRFGDARTLIDNRLVREDVHTDTGVPMEGELPHWDFVRERVLAMAAAVPQLEYMGFDVAITQEGLKLLEVNRYPDYPRISRLTKDTIGYLLGRIEAKKRFMKVDEGWSLVKLPRRDA